MPAESAGDRQSHERRRVLRGPGHDRRSVVGPLVVSQVTLTVKRRSRPNGTDLDRLLPSVYPEGRQTSCCFRFRISGAYPVYPLFN
jgi:hypothetical protein